MGDYWSSSWQPTQREWKSTRAVTASATPWDLVRYRGRPAETLYFVPEG